MPITRPVLADVARLAGVSAMTVSNVMTGKPGVAAATRQKVTAAADELGYVPNVAARGLARGRTNLIGVLSHDLTVQYSWEIVRGITDELAEAGLEILISATYQDSSRELERVRFLSSGVVDGLLLIGPVLDAETSDAIAAAAVPAVIVDPRLLHSSLPNISADNHGGALAATRHLIAKGHRRIGIIEGDPEFDSSRERRRGYLDALDEAGIRSDDSLAIAGDFTQAGGFAAATELLDLAQPPTAIFATADVSAMGAIDAARSRGMDVPRNLSVVGFDDIPQASVAFPALTTVRQQLEKSGREAVRLLIRLIEGVPSQPALSVELPTTLIERETVAPFTPNGGEER
ncbi:LacI family DNA-binding transcriptional regulator [Leifsonia poae]|uniref:LacI family DNA-binding transcriptional regulator n=1 Tax=Leifsonia poae TaxID=110933 RepID=UPI001CBE6D8B|nr:LacI family DNA-binding transcriptional regulator [Leifsonia poae]